MKKVFISQPMCGLSHDEIMQARSTIEKRVNAICGPVEILESYQPKIFDSSKAKNKPLYFLGASLELLATADVAVFAGEWESARGCLMERMACEQYGVETLVLR